MNNNIFCHEPTAFDVLLDIRMRLPEFLQGSRLMHTISVESEAVCIAKHIFSYLGIDDKYLYDISASALLHDITKRMSEEQQIELCQKYGLEYINDGVLHSHTGAYFAKETFGISDICFGAIYYHTTGKDNMNVFEKIIFIADYIEKTRTNEHCKKARDYFYSNIDKNENKMEVLDKTILMSLNSTISYLTQKGLHINRQTIKAKDFLLAEYALQ